MIVLGLLLGTVGQDIYTGSPARFVSSGGSTGGTARVAVRHVRGCRDPAEPRGRGHEDRADPHRGQLQPPARTAIAIDQILPAPARIGAGDPPGRGARAPSFASYTLEKRVSRDPRSFGHGAIEGVAGPESANNAAAQTSFIPLLTLGLPAHPVMALMFGAFIIRGSRRAERHRQRAGAVLGPRGVDVDRQPAARAAEPAAHRIWVRLLAVPYRVLFQPSSRSPASARSRSTSTRSMCSRSRCSGCWATCSSSWAASRRRS